MKLKNRILSALLLIVFTVINTIAMPAFADFTDVSSDAKVYTAVSVLSKLGVINGYEDGSFKPENNVTRAEFTAMLLRTRGLGSLGSTDLENPPFPDVSTSDVSWAIGNIRTAREMGIINGYEDGTFRPNDNVLYEEAVKMIVCALGYENFGTPGSEWYSKYIMQANSLGFLANSGGVVGTPATRATIAQMLYNCLEVDLAEDNEVTEKTILENDLKLVKKTGYIASNAETSLTAPDTNLKADEIEINAPSDNSNAYTTLTYKVDNASEYKDMLGAQITFYYSEDRATDTRTVIMATVKNSESVTIKAENLETSQCNSNTIAYYKDDNASNTTTVRISDDSIVVYNGKLYGNNESNSSFADYYNAESDPIPTIGSIKLLDRDGDRSYDIVFIEKYEAYYVSSVTSSNYTIVDNLLAGAGRKEVLNPDTPAYEMSFVDDSGKDTTFSSIKTGSVVCVKTSNAANGGTVNKVAVVTNKSVSGTVKGVSAGKSVKINGTDYKYSEQAPWVLKTYTGSDALKEPEMSETGKYYLDMDGNIIAYDKTEVSSNQQYGYIMKANYKSGAIEDDQLVLNIITQSGSKTKYSAYKKTKVNGKTYDDLQAILDALEETAKPDPDNDYDSNDIKNDKYSQLIKFSTTTNKGETVLDEIYTVTDATKISSGQDVTSDTLTYYTGVTGSESATYNSSNKQLKGTSKTLNIGSSIIFSIPEDRGDTDAYRKMAATGLSHNKKYNAEFYDLTTTNSAKVVLIYNGADKSGDVTPTSPVVVVTDIERANNESDGEMYQITGFNGSSAVTYWCSPDSESVWDTVRKGDVVRLGTDNKGYYTLKAEDIVFGLNVDRDEIAANDGDGDDKTYIVSLDSTASYAKRSYETPQYRAIWGSAYQRDDSLITVSLELLTDGDDVSTEENIFSIDRSKFNNAKIYIYDTTGRDLEITEVDKSENAATIDSLDLFNGVSAPSEVFIHMSGSAVRAMIIVER